MPSKPSPEPLYTVAQVAEALGISTRRVRELISLGKLEAVNVGLGDKHARYRISARAFSTYLAERRVVT